MPARRFRIDRIEAVLFEHLDGGFGRRKQKVVFARAEPEQFQTFFLVGIVQCGKMLFFPKKRHRLVRVRRWIDDSEQPRTVHADIRELSRWGMAILRV